MAKSKQKKIEIEQYYTLKDIVSGEWFGWATTFRTARIVVENDHKNKNILKALITDEGRQKRYHFKGSNIIKFIKMVEDGKLQLK